MTPSPSAGAPDRRTNRSEDTLVALTRLLESTRGSSAIDVLAVADNSGCLVAGVGPRQRCLELAAFAPIVQKQKRSRIPRVASTDRLYRKLRLPGLEVYLCAEAPSWPLAESGVRHAQEGCERILAATM